MSKIDSRCTLTYERKTERRTTMFHPETIIDGYKFGHRTQYGPEVTRVLANFTPRATRVPGHEELVYFGGQYYRDRWLTQHWNDHFFAENVEKVCKRYLRRVTGYLGPDAAKIIGTDHIRDLHELGYLPLQFCALPEGTAVPLRVPAFTIENTHPHFGWLPNYLETHISSEIWQPCTSATTALWYRRLFDRECRRTGSNPVLTGWQGHDFSFRGMPGVEAAALSGAGHLLFFEGTDTVPALDLIEQYYGVTPEGGLPDNYLIGGSVNATEHSVMCAGGEGEEFETIDRLLDLYPTGILSVVSDTWDIWHVITAILPRLKAKIMARPGKYVTRPDSGDPVLILCGDPSAPVDHPSRKGVVELLWDIFGGSYTAEGYRVLDPHVGSIYGDSITESRAAEICARLAAKGFASGTENVVYGIGSFTYQYVTRDTYGIAIKSTWIEKAGVGRDIFKRPVTDTGLKNSARGRLACTKNADGKLTLIEGATPQQEAESLYRPVWRNGKSLIHESYIDIRMTARQALLR